MFSLDIPVLREKLNNPVDESSKLIDVWQCVKRLAYENPEENPWYLPFVAVIEDDPEMVIKAKQAINKHLDHAVTEGSRGYLFNIWCFAFPHCRWAIWFDFMRQGGYYTDEEIQEVAAKFVTVQLSDHYAGMLIKPLEKCADNQAASLVLSCYIVGSIFADDLGAGHIARKMRDEAGEHIETMIGGMPKSGYSGEGSTYQGLIVAFAIPFLTMVLEDLRGEDLFDSPLKPNGTSPKDILDMTAKLWMPGSVLLPWDDYGYQYGIAFPLSLLAHRTGDKTYTAMLEKAVGWSRLNTGASGWGFDEPVWALVFWPDSHGNEDLQYTDWLKQDLGGALVDAGGDNYLMQMWDSTEHMCIRSHVNPNSLIIAHKGIPFCADGSAGPECTLEYDGAVFERSFGPGAFQRLNLSKGCAGSHNTILIDNNQGFRPSENYVNSCTGTYSENEIIGDVTPLYQDVYSDCQMVKRRTRLVEDRFWLVEDLVVFDEEHDFTSRWMFRPDATKVPGGVDVTTPEGKVLQMRSLLGSGAGTVERVPFFPKVPDNCSDRVDYVQRGKRCRWLWVFWPTDVYAAEEALVDGWEATVIDGDVSLLGDIDFESGTSYGVHPGTLPWLQEDVPIARKWAFRLKLENTEKIDALRLPRGICPESRLWINGEEQTLTDVSILVPKYLSVNTESETLEIVILLDFAVGHLRNQEGVSAPDMPVAICRRDDDYEQIDAVDYMDGQVVITTSRGTEFKLKHDLMQG